MPTELLTEHAGTKRLLADIANAEDVIDPSRTPPPTKPTVLTPRYESPSPEEEMDAQVRRTTNATVASLLPNRRPDIAIWLDARGVKWQTDVSAGTARDLDQCFEDVRLAVVHEDIRPGVPLNLDRVAQDRIIQHERSAGRGEPRIAP